MKYYLNGNSYRNLKHHIEKYGKDLDCVAHHNDKNYLGASNYYHFFIEYLGKAIEINTQESYQNMNILRQWHLNMYEIGIQWDGNIPERKGILANIYNPSCRDNNERMRTKTSIHMGTVLNKSQYLYYTLFI